MNQSDNLSSIPSPSSSDSSAHSHPSAFNTDERDMDSDLNLDILGNGLKMTEEKPISPTVEPKAAPPMPTSSPQPAIAKQSEPEELLRLLRDPHSGQLIVQIGEQRYTKLADIADKKIGQFILKLAAHFLAFTGGMIVTNAGVKNVYNPKVSTVPEPITAPPVSMLQAATMSQPPAPPKTEATVQPPPPKPSPEIGAPLSSLSTPVPEPATSRGLFGRPKPAATPSLLPTINLAKEINEIVQNRLMYSPLASNTKIEISSAIDGGIRINVNGAIYNSPDEVPDVEAKTLIKESIKQWERS